MSLPSIVSKSTRFYSPVKNFSKYHRSLQKEKPASKINLKVQNRFFSKVNKLDRFVSASFSRPSLITGIIKNPCHSRSYSVSNTQSSIPKSGQRASKTPSESNIEKLLAFSSDPQLRNLFVNHWNQVRVGLLLEELDRLAGAVAYKHALNSAAEVVGFLAQTTSENCPADNPMKSMPMVIVTAGVDSIGLYRPLAITNDLKLRGRVVYVGKSSMEILLQVDALIKDETNGTIKVERAIEAYFTMVARSPGGETAYEIPALCPQTEEEKLLYQTAIEHRANRKQSVDHRLDAKLPTNEEYDMLHSVFFERQTTHDSKRKTIGATRSFGTESVKMGSTFRSSVYLMHPQKRNIHNKVFGGYLMRLAFEQAWSSCWIFAGSLPSFVACDDINFISAVPLGSLVTFDNTIVFSRPGKPGTTEIVVEVKANVLNPSEKTEETTNTFFFFFKTPTCNQQVIPWTYEESMKWIDGKRRLEAIIAARNNTNKL